MNFNMIFNRKKETPLDSIIEINGNINKENNYCNKKYTESENASEGMYLSKLIKRLKGINGQWNVSIRRYKKEYPDNKEILIKKRILVYITIPIIRDILKLENKIVDLGEMTVSKGKIYTEDTAIDGIKLLCGVIIIKDEDSLAYTSYIFLNKILQVMFDKDKK